MSHAAPRHHVLPLGVYWAVFLALIAGTLVTVWSATIDLGMWNTPIALLIASAKAVLVVLFFMHVKYSSRLTWLFAMAGFVWTLIMFGIMMVDFAGRGV